MARGGQIDFLLAGLRDSSGEPLAGGKVYFYSVGTTTLKSVYTDQGLSAAAAIPCVLDSRGVSGSTRTATSLYAFVSYKIKITDADDVTQYTFDNLLFGAGANAQRGTATAASAQQTAFTVPFSYDTDANNLVVTQNGVVIAEDNYAKTNTTTITLTAAQAQFVTAGDVFEFIEV